MNLDYSLKLRHEIYNSIICIHFITYFKMSPFLTLIGEFLSFIIKFIRWSRGPKVSPRKASRSSEWWRSRSTKLAKRSSTRSWDPKAARLYRWASNQNLSSKNRALIRFQVERNRILSCCIWSKMPMSLSTTIIRKMWCLLNLPELFLRKNRTNVFRSYSRDRNTPRKSNRLARSIIRVTISILEQQRICNLQEGHFIVSISKNRPPGLSMKPWERCLFRFSNKI